MAMRGKNNSHEVELWEMVSPLSTVYRYRLRVHANDALLSLTGARHLLARLTKVIKSLEQRSKCRRPRRVVRK